MIIKADKSDLKMILELQYLSYQSEAKLLNDFEIPPLKQTYNEVEQEYQRGLFLKAIDENGKIVGSVRAYIDDDIAYIGKLIVHPDKQGQGIGTKLLIAIEQNCPVTKYELFTSDKSMKNIRLYERLGYTRFREQKISDGLTFVYLKKNANSMLSIAELTTFLESNGADFEILMHETPIISTQDAVKYFDIRKAAPTFIMDTEQGFVALVGSSMQGRLNYKEMRQILGYSKFKMADREKVKRITGYSVGTIPLIGHRLPCVFDNRLLELDYIFGGSGDEYHTLKIAPKDVIRLNNIIKHFALV